MHLTQTCEQNTKVIVDLRNGSDGTARRVRQVALFDSNRGTQAINSFHDGLWHLPNKLTYIRAQTLDETPLTFGIDSIHGHGSFAAPALTAEYRHLIAREREIDIFQIVLLCTDDMDVLQSKVFCNRFFGLSRILRRFAFRVRSRMGFEVSF